MKIFAYVCIFMRMKICPCVRIYSRRKKNLHVVELLMSQKTLPWPLFVNQGFYIPKCFLSCVDFKNGSCHFFF